MTEALRTGPYGRCVYACDNDVVDHQVVNMQFEDGATASFTMTAFNRQRDRETRIFGTRGELTGNGRFIEVYDFLTDTTERIDAETASDGSILSGHGGGDLASDDAFRRRAARGRPLADPVGSRRVAGVALDGVCGGAGPAGWAGGGCSGGLVGW